MNDLIAELTPSLIILDLGNVLIDCYPRRFAERINQLTDKSPLYVSERYCGGVIKEAFERGYTDELDFFAEMADWLNLSRRQIKELMILWSDIFAVKNQAERVLEGLTKNYPVWILSDTNITHYNYCSRQYPFLNKAERFIASFETGFLKKDPGAFERVIRIAGITPDKIVFLDDLEVNITAAKQAGLQAFQFTNWAEWGY
ncbi:MAG: HAD-IA family hydrolase [Calditrichota bacterium]